MLMSMDFDFLVYSKNRLTPLSMAIYNGCVEIAIMILEYTKIKFGDYDVYMMIHASNKDYNYRQ